MSYQLGNLGAYQMGNMDSGLTILVAVITALSSTAAWDFYQKRSVLKQSKEQKERDETHLYRDDLREEVKRLRVELGELHGKREKELKEMQIQISDLKEQLATFKTRVEFLEKENAELRDALQS